MSRMIFEGGKSRLIKGKAVIKAYKRERHAREHGLVARRKERAYRVLCWRLGPKVAAMRRHSGPVDLTRRRELVPDEG